MEPFSMHLGTNCLPVYLSTPPLTPLWHHPLNPKEVKKWPHKAVATSQWSNKWPEVSIFLLHTEHQSITTRHNIIQSQNFHRKETEMDSAACIMPYMNSGSISQIIFNLKNYAHPRWMFFQTLIPWDPFTALDNHPLHVFPYLISTT